VQQTTRHRNTQRSALRWLILVALTWSQLSFAVHQFDHKIVDLGEPCAVCVNLDRDDDALIDDGQPNLAPAIFPLETRESPTPALTPLRTSFSARASP